MNILNNLPEGDRDEAVSMTPEELSRYLQTKMLELKAEYMGPDGQGVDYLQLPSSKLFSEYVHLSAQLVTCDPSQLSEESRMAFFISILSKFTTVHKAFVTVVLVNSLTVESQIFIIA